MIPMKTSSVFKSRWMALLWASGFIWFAYDFASSQHDSSPTNAEQGNDGAAASSDDQNKAADILKGL